MTLSESTDPGFASNWYLCTRLFHTFDCCGPRHLCRRNSSMDDVYKINVAKTEFREAYETGNVDRLASVFSPSGFTDMSEGGPSKYGPEAIATLRDRASQLFEKYSVKMTPIIIHIGVTGN